MDMLKPSMYVRTKHQGICRIIGFASSITEDYIENEKGFIIPKYEISKASHSLLGNDEEPCLIEVGDYVNGERVINIMKKHKYLEVSDEEIVIAEKDIKSIVTKEQFSQIEYKVGD